MPLPLSCHCVTHTNTSAADPQEALLLRRQRTGTLLSEALSHAGVCRGWIWKPDPLLFTNQHHPLHSLSCLRRQWDPIVSSIRNAGTRTRPCLCRNCPNRKPGGHHVCIWGMQIGSCYMCSQLHIFYYSTDVGRAPRKTFAACDERW